ncbi:MAG TPA: nucleotidyltransferase [Cytophagales bacterium]|jgi:hypothetical protein|nr:nucleotidyltransferase [Cytophagales bacterium]
MIAAQKVDQLTRAEKAVIRALLYFDIFKYPLTREELFTFAPEVCSDTTVLDELVANEMIYQVGKFYSVRNDLQLSLRREEGNTLAAKKMKAAQRVAKLISFFPFIRSVQLSGSISKGYMDSSSDIDFFIITEANRLWIVRTSLALFRRVFLFNSHKYLCTNYFVDVQNLQIPDRNIFTATELITLKPMYGKVFNEKFREQNQWVFSFLPQGNFREHVYTDPTWIFRSLMEKFFSIFSLDQFNQWLMQRTLLFWKKKYSTKIGVSDFEIAFRTKEGVSKSHPQFFQKKVLSIYQEHISAFEFTNGVDLSL